MENNNLASSDQNPTSNMEFQGQIDITPELVTEVAQCVLEMFKIDLKINRERLPPSEGIQPHVWRSLMSSGMQFLNLTSASFRFVVAIDGSPTAAFTECTLPTIEWDAVEVKEGGLNTYVHQLPGRRKLSTITLKNGVGIASDLMAWYIATMNERFKRRRITITLLNRTHIPIMVWHIENAYPKKWTGPQLQTDENTIAIQSLELACGEVIIG